MTQDVHEDALHQRPPSIVFWPIMIVFCLLYFGGMAIDDRAAILLRAAQLATDAGDLDRARRLAAASVDADDRNPDGWFLLGQLAASQDRDADAAAAFARLVEGWPEAAGHLTPQMVNPVVHGLGLDSQPRLDLLQALFKAGWTMHGIPPDHAWAQLALMRADRGDATGARAALAGIASPGVLAWIRSDRRFDPLFDRDDPRYDPVPAAKAWVTRLRAAAAAAPASLALQGELGQALLVAGHPEEALALADAAIAAPAGFDDAGELHWMLNLRAVASRRLGRTADALAALAGAAAMDESGAPNVSQVLNLGTLLADMQRPMEALAAVARVGGTSGYGDMVQSMTRLRAHRQLGQDDDAAVVIGALRRLMHLPDLLHPVADALWQTLVRAGAVDGPAGRVPHVLVTELWHLRADALQRDLADHDDLLGEQYRIATSMLKTVGEDAGDLTWLDGTHVRAGMLAVWDGDPADGRLVVHGAYDPDGLLGDVVGPAQHGYSTPISSRCPSTSLASCRLMGCVCRTE